jgi:hypothetical protein
VKIGHDNKEKTHFKTCWLLVMEEQLAQYISNKLKKMVVPG